jgi:hypothetical protein
MISSRTCEVEDADQEHNGNRADEDHLAIGVHIVWPCLDLVDNRWVIV